MFQVKKGMPHLVSPSGNIEGIRGQAVEQSEPSWPR